MYSIRVIVPTHFVYCKRVFNKMSIKESEVVLARLKQVFSVSSDVALCEALSVSPQTLSSWKSRNKIPYANCVEVSTQRNVSLDWLLTGRGAMHLTSNQVESRDCSQCAQQVSDEMTVRERKLLELFRALPSEEQKNILLDAEKGQRLHELEREVKELQELKATVERLKNAV
ncbi:bacteriophage CI repressor [Salmonella enterica subsp. enterica]|nr:transcriptional regulator [Salmonella enterica]EDY2185695.1 bacteriophage CI repressor [Salmonella enterica subsp. enterica]EAA9596950.1 transcriptional regulator [Salmonella enterica]EAO9639346.1 transcriptional regulator [Salmonella enterica]EDO2134350.1 bacteriophage CI repressor [Salmonella enterica]